MFVLFPLLDGRAVDRSRSPFPSQRIGDVGGAVIDGHVLDKGFTQEVAERFEGFLRILDQVFISYYRYVRSSLRCQGVSDVPNPDFWGHEVSAAILRMVGGHDIPAVADDAEELDFSTEKGIDFLYVTDVAWSFFAQTRNLAIPLDTAVVRSEKDSVEQP